MGRPRTIHVDDAAILATIQACHAADVAELTAAAAEAQAAYEAGDVDRYDGWKALCGLRTELQAKQQDGIPCDLARFWQRQPTASERITLQKCIRRLEAAGLVERHGSTIRPVEALDNA